MKLIQINTVCNGSTGKIMYDIQKKTEELGYETISFYGRRKAFSDLKCEKFGNQISFWFHVIITTIFDKHGCGSYFYTKKIIKRLREENPNIIHLHNIHGYYLNYPLLFKYLKNEYKGKIIWTLHDCWSFTGHCPYFTAVKCEKWKTGCQKCPNKKLYPTSLFLDNSINNYLKKKKLFTGIKNMTIAVPSAWLQKLVENSYLKEYNINIVNNWIDANKFYYCVDEKIFKKYNIPENKKILLGVASIWDDRKGLKTFIELSTKIDKEYVIVLVGLNSKQISKLPKNIIGIRRTENQNELTKIYSASKVLINPSEEETFSLVTLESLACGTPVIVLNTSAVKELVTESNGIVLNKNEISEYVEAINLIDEKQFNREKIIEFSSKYNIKNKIKEYIELYEKS